MFRFLGRRRTFESVATELIQGFENGSIILDLPEAVMEVTKPESTQKLKAPCHVLNSQDELLMNSGNPQTRP